MRKLIIFALLINVCVLHAAAPPGPPSEAPSGEEILERIDNNFYAENRVSISSMIIRGVRGTRTIKAKSWVQGMDKAFTEYLSPAREKGTKMLKIKGELWTWSPSTDRIIRIAGHMLRQSLMGSDVSYEDFMEDPELSNIYNARVTGEETIDGRPCYLLELKAKKSEVSYYSKKFWVDKERYVPLRQDWFAKAGKLLKTVVIHEVFKVENRWYPRRMTFRDVLKKGSGTEFNIESIDFNVEIPEHIFSKASLRR